MKRLFSAGGVVFRKRGDKTEVLLISTKGGEVWALPKGLIEKGETPQEAALREIEEETAVKGRIIGELGEVSYWFNHEGKRYFKTVKYFLVEFVEGEAKPNFEVSATEWFSLAQAINRLTYKSDKEILRKAIEILDGESSR